MDPRPVLRSARGAGDRSHLVEGLREFVREEAEASDIGRPAPAVWNQLQDVDLERVARLGAGDLDRAVDLVDPAEVERLEVGQRRDGRQLSKRGIEAIEGDDVA